MSCLAPAAAEVRGTAGPKGLGTRVNGAQGGSCHSGRCGVSGGTGAGGNLFHRFDAFDTRGAIQGVSIDSSGYRNVILGVLSPLGSFIDKPVSLSSRGALFWLSPGGIAISGQGGFQNVGRLTLSTATGLRLGSGSFDVFSTTAAQAAQLSADPVVGRLGLFSDPESLAAIGLQRNGDLSLNGGEITVERDLLLDAQGGHVLLENARIAAADPQGAGGSIDVLGDSITVANSTIDTSAAGDGGQIRIGGDPRGVEPLPATARTVEIDATSVLRADGLGQADGGRVIVWGAESARVQGSISARGGEAGGNGGFVETSGGQLSVERAPDVGAAVGQAGTWLIDPFDIEIVDPATISDGDPITSGSSPFIGEGSGISTTKLNGALLQEVLDAGGTVIVDTSDTPGNSGTGVGDITVNTPITTTAGSSGARLELRANNDINLNRSITSTASPLDVAFVSDQDNSAAGALRWGSATLELRGGTATARDVTVTPGAAAVLAAGSALDVGRLTLGSGSLTLDGPAVFNEALSISGGRFSGAGDVSVPGIFNWSGGFISGSGGLQVDGPLTISSQPLRSNILDERTLLHTNASGASTLASNTGLSLRGGARLVNATDAVLSLGVDQGSNTFIAGGVGKFQNSGTLIKTGQGSSRFSGFDNSGTFQVTNGLASISSEQAVGVDSGSYVVDAGASLLFFLGSRSLRAGTTFSGDGEVSISFDGRMSIDGPTASTVRTLNFFGGNITGSSVFTVDGAFNWVPGTSDPGVINGAVTLLMNGPFLLDNKSSFNKNATIDGATLIHASSLGSSSVASGSRLVLSNGGRLINANSAALAINVGNGELTQIVGGLGDASFENLGTLNKSGPGTFEIFDAGQFFANTRFNNNGRFTTSSGTSIISGEGIDTGNYQVAAGASLSFGTARSGSRTIQANGNSTFTGSDAFRGEGQVLFNRAIIDFVGAQSSDINQPITVRPLAPVSPLNLVPGSLTEPSNGSVTDTSGGALRSLSYEPSSGFSGTDSFSYEVTDSVGIGQEATITIQVGAGGGGSPPPSGNGGNPPPSSGGGNTPPTDGGGGTPPLTGGSSTQTSTGGGGGSLPPGGVGGGGTLPSAGGGGGSPPPSGGSGGNPLPSPGTLPAGGGTTPSIGGNLPPPTGSGSAPPIGSTPPAGTGGVSLEEITEALTTDSSPAPLSNEKVLPLLDAAIPTSLEPAAQSLAQNSIDIRLDTNDIPLPSSTGEAWVSALPLASSPDSSRANQEAQAFQGLQHSLTPMTSDQAVEAFQSAEQRSMEEVSEKLALISSARSTPLTVEELQNTLRGVAEASNQDSYRPAALRISITADQQAAQRGEQAFLDLTLVSKDEDVVGRRVGVDSKRFNQLLRQLYQQVARQSSMAPEISRAPARQLYDLLIRPLEAELRSRGITTLLLSVDQGLQGIPYAALHDGHSYLGERLAFSLTPSISLMPLDVPPSTGARQLLRLGASQFPLLAPLPLVPQEIERLASAAPGRAYLNDQFTPRELLERAADPSVGQVHVATHADFLPGGPSESKLYTGTGPVSLARFASLRQRRQGQPLELFSLSACRTALGDPDSELGFAGLALQAGSRSAIGSLWYVDDVATSAFFVQFYHYLHQGLPKAEAMRATRRLFASGGVRLEGARLVGEGGMVLLSDLSPLQQELAANGMDHPYFWSGITLLGTPW